MALVLSSIGVTAITSDQASAVTAPVVVAGVVNPTNISQLLPGEVRTIATDSSGRLLIGQFGKILRVGTGGALSTIVGGDVSGFSGDNGPATSAQLQYPSLITRDASNNLYFYDGSNQRVRKVTAGGTISTIYGNGDIATTAGQGDGGPATSAPLPSYLGSLVATSNGTVFAADQDSYRIRKVAPNGDLSTFAAANQAATTCSGFPGAANAVVFASLDGLTIDGSGDLVASVGCGDLNGDRLVRFSADGTNAAIIGGGGAEPIATGVSVSTANLGVVASPSYVGSELFFWTYSGLFKLTGSVVTLVNESGPMNCPFATGDPLASICISDIAADPNGGFFVTGFQGAGHVSAAGAFNALSASETSPADGAHATQAPFGKSLWSFTSDSAGRLYFATATGSKVRRVGTDGIVGTIAGNGVIDPLDKFGGLGGPAKSSTMPMTPRLSTGSDGSIIITGATQVAKVTPSGSLVHIAGNGTPGFSGDGGSAKSAKLYASAAVEAGGSYYIVSNKDATCGSPPFTYSCASDQIIRRVSPNGVISTVYVPVSGTYFGSIAAGPDGSILLVDNPATKIVRLNPLTHATSVVNLPAGQAPYYGSRIVADSAGTAFVSASAVLLKVTAAGKVSTLDSSGYDGDVGIDAVGNLYVGSTSAIVKYAGVAAKKAEVTQVSAGTSHSCARLSNGTAECWGANASGQLGIGGTVVSKVPVTVPGLSGVGQVSAGGAFSCAVLTPGVKGTVKCWGANSSGQLGRGNKTLSSVPVTVLPSGSTAALKGAASVATGDAFACAVVAPGANGTVRCWGKNSSGQLGDGTTTTRTKAVKVLASAGVPLKGVTSVAAGGATACATLTSGSVRCWGSNNHGQLGRGNTANSSFAVQVAGINGSAAKSSKVEVGSNHACAVLTTGGVRCWGLNSSGQLGDGTLTQRTSPVAVTTSATAKLSGVKAVAAGGNHSCAIVGAGAAARVRCWGSDGSGQLGNTASGVQKRAVATAGTVANGASALAAGGSHTLAVVPGTPSTTKDVAAWGLNSSGQLGDGTSLNRTKPTRTPYL
jgi:alpha-tubulin suppressor-like RCC1 family protein